MEQSQEEIIAACIKRNRKAQYTFYKLYFSYLFSICLRYTNDRDEAMSVVNLSFARIMMNLKKYDSKQPLKVWIRKVTLNCIIDEFRKSKSYKEHLQLGNDMKMEQANSISDHQSIGSNLAEVVQTKLKLLSPVTRSVFNLYAVDGYKHREIAEMLNISEGTSAWHYSEARKAIKEYLEPEYKTLLSNGRASA